MPIDSARFGRLLILLALLLAHAGCRFGGPPDESAYVVPERMRLRSSTAQAARTTDELRGADLVTITDRIEAEDGTAWVEVRGPGGERGWAEARFFVRGELVEASRQIAGAYRTVLTQALGRARAPLKLRLTPDRSSEENVALLLAAGVPLEIVAHERRPRPRRAVAGTDAADSAPPLPGGRTASTQAIPDDDDWLLVRVRGFSVVSTGWVYGAAVGIETPPEIVYFVSNGHRITGWQRIATVTGEDGRRGDHFLVLEERISGRNPALDFDRVRILAYDPVTRGYQTPFRAEISGRYPVSLEMNGSQGRATIPVVGRDGRTSERVFCLELRERAGITMQLLAASGCQPAIK